MPLSFFDRLFGKNEKSAKSIAKDRLRLVLMHDRADIPACRNGGDSARHFAGAAQASGYR